MEIHLLGAVEAAADGHPVALGPPQQRAVLAMLALVANRPVQVERLIAGLWGDEAPPSARKVVQLYVCRLRRALAGGGCAIATGAASYELRLPSECIDLVRFEHLVHAGAVRDGLAL